MFGKRKASTKVTIETHEVTRLRLRPGRSGTDFCPVCGCNVAVLAGHQAAQFFAIDEEVIHSLLVSNLVHQSNKGMFCGRSLSVYFK